MTKKYDPFPVKRNKSGKLITYKKPERQTATLIEFRLSTFDIDSMQDLVDWADKYGLNYEDLTFQYDWDEGISDFVAPDTFSTTKLQEEYDARYENELQAWATWYENNKQEINDMAEQANLRKKKRLEKEKSKLEEQAAVIAAKLKNL